jgi:predicted nucleic acid-binding protein
MAGSAHPLHGQALDMFRRVADGRLKLILTPVIVAELSYAAAAVLGWDRAETAARVATLLRADGLIVKERDVLVQALDLSGRHAPLDFADAYLAALALVDGPNAVASFDRDLDNIAGVQRLTV